MAKTKKTALSIMGKKIMGEAKKIKKRNPGKKWQNCVKEASKNFKK